MIARYKIYAELGGTNNGWTHLRDAIRGSINASRGLPGTSFRDLVAKTGVFTWVMNNSESNSRGLLGLYTPDHVNCLPGWGVNTGIQLRIAFGGDIDESPFITIVTPGTRRPVGFDGYLGCKFTTSSQPVTVVALGFYKLPGHVLSHPIYIQDMSGINVAWGNVQTAGAANYQFEYVHITPVTLAANTSYHLLTYEGTTEPVLELGSILSIDPYCGVINSASFYSSGWNETGSAGMCYGPLNFLVDKPPVAESKYSDLIIASNPSNYWRLNESGSAVADIIGGATGTISGGVLLNQPGALVDTDPAAAFNGTGQISVNSLLFSRVCSIEGWMKSSAAGYQGMVSSYNLPGITGEAIAVGIYTDMPVAAGSAAATVFGAAISVGVWHHLVFVFDGASVLFYVDGALNATQPFVRNTSGSGQMQMGYVQGVAGLTGSLDEIAIYSRKLTAAEIFAHYNAAYQLKPGSSEPEEFVKWTGRLSLAKPSVGIAQQRRVQCTAVDYMDQCARKRVTQLPLTLDARDDEVWQIVLDAMPIQPRGVRNPRGFDTIRYAFDNNENERASAMSEFQRLAQSTLRRTYVIGDGTLVHELRSTRSLTGSPTAALSPSDYPQGETIEIDDNRNEMVNRVQITLHPRAVNAAETNVVLFSLDSVPLLQPGVTHSLRGLYTEPGLRAQRAGGLDMLPAIAGTDYIVNTAADGSGENVTSSTSVTTVFTANSVLFAIIVPKPAYLIKLQARGTGVFDSQNTVVEATDDPSIEFLGENEFKLDMPYSGDVSFGSEVAQYLLFISQRNIKRVRSVKLQLDAVGPERAKLFAIREISDRVAAAEPMTALDTQFHINAMTFTEGADGDVWLQWMCAVADSTQYWYLEIPGFTELGYTTVLGFSLIIGHTDINHEDFHGDVGHADIAHVDLHGDVVHGDQLHADTPHTDGPVHTDIAHVDIAHSDGHSDSHTDVTHQDSHGDLGHSDGHGDSGAHQDISHEDYAHWDDHADQHTDLHNDWHSDFYSGGHYDQHADGHDDSHVDEHGDVGHQDRAHSDSSSHTDYHADGAHVDGHVDITHQDSHADGGHVDSPHNDQNHQDIAHGDFGHTDVGHQDYSHTDDHSDVTHQDAAHSDVHNDVGHGDAN